MNSRILLSTLLAFLLGATILLFSDLKLKYMLAFAVCLCFPFFVQYVGSLRYALMAVLIFSLSTQMSFNPFYSDYYAQTQMGFRISLTMLIIIGAYTLWLFEWMTHRRGVRWFPQVTVPLICLIFWGGASYFFSEKPDITVFLFTQVTVGFFVYFYAANFIETHQDLQFILKWAAITVIVTSLITIIQYFKPDFLNLKFMGWSEEPLKLYYGSKVITRPPAFLGHANNVAAFLVSWLPLFFIVLVASVRQLTQNLWTVLAFLTGCCALILTFSRGGWLTFIFAIGLILVLISGRRIQEKLPDLIPRILVLGVLSVLLVAPFSPYIIKRLTRDDYNASTSRIELAQDALELFAQQPVRGMGLGYYLDFLPIPPHNIYLQTAVEMGSIGLILFLWISCGFFKEGLKALSQSHQLVLLFVIGILSGLAAAYLHGMVELGTIAYHKFLTYLFIGGLLVGLGNRQLKEAPL